jgi:integrase
MEGTTAEEFMASWGQRPTGHYADRRRGTAGMGTITERRTGKGKIVFDAAVRRRGCKKTYRSFTRLTDAKDWIQEMEYKIRAGVITPPSDADQHTLSDAIERFLIEELPKKPKIFKDQKRHILWFKKQIGYKKLSQVTPALITEMKGKFLRERTNYTRLRKPQTWNRYLSGISCVFDVCCKDWQWLEHNPARRVRKEREAPGRVRFLSDDERKRLLDACKASRSPNLYPLVILTLSTGMRRGEVWRLTWQQVDLANGVIILLETKNKQPRRVPVRGLALELLRQHARVRRIDTNLVFPGHGTAKTGNPFNLHCFWKRAVKEAGLENFRFHDLRHTTASWLAMDGASLLEIAEVLGHKTLQMAKRYSHLAESHVAGVVEHMNQKVFGG